MTSARSGLALRRVLLAFDPGAPLTQPLAAARTLVETLGAELAGLFVEDINLLRLAALPFTREVGATSGMSRPIELADVERTLRVQAESAKRLLSELAAELSVPWSFHVERGDVLQHVLAQMTESVAAVLVPPTLSRRLEPAAGARAARPGSSARHLLVVWDHASTETHTVAIALRLAAAQHAALTLAVVGDESKPLPPALASLLASAPPGFRMLSLPRSEAAALVRQLRATGSDLLILSSRALAEDPGRLRALIAGVGSPVVLLG
jgi:hypothetical protein